MAFLILLIVAVAGSAGMTAVVAWLIHRTSRVEGGDVYGADRLHAESEGLREQLLALEDEVERLRERVDFTERLLERPRERTEVDSGPTGTPPPGA
ncbi:MAG TPA: hypothetical protein VLL48_03505 [Longimicrobiales bacterium]|nr:hypothetical protein [Longimicrobiales bacterium]